MSNSLKTRTFQLSFAKKIVRFWTGSSSAWRKMSVMDRDTICLRQDFFFNITINKFSRQLYVRYVDISFWKATLIPRIYANCFLPNARILKRIHYPWARALQDKTLSNTYLLLSTSQDLFIILPFACVSSSICRSPLPIKRLLLQGRKLVIETAISRLEGARPDRFKDCFSPQT